MFDITELPYSPAGLGVGLTLIILIIIVVAVVLVVLFMVYRKSVGHYHLVLIKRLILLTVALIYMLTFVTFTDISSIQPNCST